MQEEQSKLGNSKQIIDEAITIMLLNLKVAVLDNSANLGIIEENRRNSVKSKKEAKYINNAILSHLSALLILPLFIEKL